MRPILAIKWAAASRAERNIAPKSVKYTAAPSAAAKGIQICSRPCPTPMPSEKSASSTMAQKQRSSSALTARSVYFAVWRNKS